MLVCVYACKDLLNRMQMNHSDPDCTSQVEFRSRGHVGFILPPHLHLLPSPFLSPYSLSRHQAGRESGY